jgi:hypothetical protein
LIVLIEHQSTINPNMPIRFLEYIARIYEKIINNKALYSSKLAKIPRPEFIVLYNGKDDYPDTDEMRLSDAFKGTGGMDTALELVVKIYNINKGHSPQISGKVKALDDYATFIAKVREFYEFAPSGEPDSAPSGEPDDAPDDTPSSGDPDRARHKRERDKRRLEKAVKKAIYWCVEHGVLKEFLETNTAEVSNMLFEYDIDTAMEVAREEAWEDGVERGREEGMERGIERGMDKGIDALIELIERGHSPREAKELLGRERSARVP